MTSDSIIHEKYPFSLQYTCLVCNLFDDEDRNQYHCEGCGICRVGGRGRFFHCKVCNMCLPMQLQVEGHKVNDVFFLLIRQVDHYGISKNNIFYFLVCRERLPIELSCLFRRYPHIAHSLPHSVLWSLAASNVFRRIGKFTVHIAEKHAFIIISVLF